MATPREILHQADVRRGQKPVQPAPAVLTPAPLPVRMAPAQLESPAPARSERVVVPQPIRSNSVYHQLMQRHDRMHTRHLQG